MWTFGGGIYGSAREDPELVALIGLAAGLALLVALTLRSVEGRRRHRRPRSRYS